MMRNIYRTGISLVILIIAASLSWHAARTQETERQYFPETGHGVEGDFLAFYLSTPNPEFVYGFPITEAFLESENTLVQYFQRARFELDLNRPDSQVQKSPLGRLLYEPGNPSASPSNSGACQGFNSGFSVCLAFLSFFNTHGGLVQFGEPISGVEKDGDRFVQYFEYARLEWYPERSAAGREIELSFLGRIYFDQRGENPLRLSPEIQEGIQEVLDLRVFVFPGKTTLYGSEAQQLVVVVQDQNYTPVKGAEVEIIFRFPNQETLELTMSATNDFGFTEITLPLDSQDTGSGRAFVDANIRHDLSQEFDKSTTTSFRINP
jgi:hypothetical protein